MINTVEDLMKILPHRYPLLLIDKVVELQAGKRVVAIKNVTINEWFFPGHFPGRPVMPGTLIVEAMAQASIVLYHTAYEDKLKKMPEYYLGSVKARFLHPVYPGDQLRIVAEMVKLLPNGAFVNVNAYVSEDKTAHTELIFAVKQ